MGMRGPAPRPLELVRAEGNPGHRKINGNNPKPKPVAPKCPPWLDTQARREWKRVAHELEILGLLTSLDLACFASYCAAYSRLVAAQRALKKEGLTFETPNGYIMPRPEVAISNIAMKIVKDFAVQFGFTPSARGRIQLPNSGSNPDDEDLD